MFTETEPALNCDGTVAVSVSSSEGRSRIQPSFWTVTLKSSISGFSQLAPSEDNTTCSTLSDNHMGYPMLSDLQDQAVRELIVWLAHGLQVQGS